MTLIIALLAGTFAFAQNANLVVQKVDNGGLVSGNTFRVYVQLTNDNHSLHAVFGDDISGMSIESTAPFYQHQYGGQTSVDVNQMIIDMTPEVAYDSWVTIGAKNGTNNNLWDIGINFDSFNNGNNLTINDGAWFLVPTDGYTLPDANNLILVAQLTTEGTATGTLNIQGWDADLQPWQVRGLTFTTTDAQTFGCTDQSASNFNSIATFDDGSCESAGGSSNGGQSPVQASKEDISWQVFPNPIWEGQFHVQFNQAIDLGKGNMTLDIIDLSGKIVLAMEIDENNIIGGNKLVVSKELPSGVYNVVVRQADFNETQQIVVQK